MTPRPAVPRPAGCARGPRVCWESAERHCGRSEGGTASPSASGRARGGRESRPESGDGARHGSEKAQELQRAAASEEAGFLTAIAAFSYSAIYQALIQQIILGSELRAALIIGNTITIGFGLWFIITGSYLFIIGIRVINQARNIQSNNKWISSPP